MAYKLNVTEHADELLDNLVYHLIYRLKNKQAAKHLLDCIDVIYYRLEVNPFQFAECRDAYLAKKGYREAVVPMDNNDKGTNDFSKVTPDIDGYIMN